MLLTIAWKNIWRNKVRSLVVIVAVMLGLWVGAFILSYVFGMMNQRINDAIGNEVSHVQIHHPKFNEDFDPKYYLSQSAEIIDSLGKQEVVRSVSGRVLTFGMVASPATTTGGKFIGIDPDSENSVTQFSNYIMEGEYLEEGDKNKIVIGKKLADKLKVSVRSKIVLTFQDVEGTIVAGAFRIKGVFEIYNSSLEENNLYVNREDLARLLNTGNEVHEIAVLLSDGDQLDPFIKGLKNTYPAVLAESWKQLLPELGLMIDSLDQYMIIFFVIIMLALSFGIVNTMLMAVLERVREIGMLMAIGMNKTKLFLMIALETIMMVLAAAPLGLLLAYSTIEYLGVTGLDLSALYQEGHATWGFRSFIYPELDSIYYFRIMILVVVTAILASIYPAITALKLDPVKAIRKI